MLPTIGTERTLLVGEGKETSEREGAWKAGGVATPVPYAFCGPDQASETELPNQCSLSVDFQKEAHPRSGVR